MIRSWLGGLSRFVAGVQTKDFSEYVLNNSAIWDDPFEIKLAGL
jgi:hypothetical protein